MNLQIILCLALPLIALSTPAFAISMVNLLQAANIPAVVGDLPPCSRIDVYRFDVGMLEYYGPGYEGITTGTSAPDVTFVPYDSIGGGMAVNPNPDCPVTEPTAQGYADMLVLAKAVLRKPQVKCSIAMADNGR